MITAIQTDDYRTDRFGVIHQSTPARLMVYDHDYVRGLAGDEVTTEAKSFLRLGAMLALLGSRLKPGASVLDMGCGAGDFLKVVARAGFKAFGHDISEFPLPEGVLDVRLRYIGDRSLSVVTFFDALEYFESMDIIGRLHCSFIVVGARECHWHKEDPQFVNWPERRYGERLHHFNRLTLGRFMEAHGYAAVGVTMAEDAIAGCRSSFNRTFIAAYMKQGPV